MGLLNWLSKTEKETRGQLRDPNWWLSTFTGSSTASGVTVTADTAMRQPAVFSCVRVISEDVASLPIKVYGRKSDTERESISSHPVAKMLAFAPNGEMTPFTFKETMTAHVLLYGNAYAEIERNGAGDPIALWILLPENMKIEIVDGTVVYIYQSPRGSARFASENIFHIKGLGHDGIIGYSPIAYARETIGISASMEKSGSAFFANSSRPSGILSHPAKLSEDAAKRLRQGWDGMYSGNVNVGKTAILEEGMKWAQLSIPHSDAQWLEARAYALQDICRIYRMPPHMVGDLSHATFSNIESQQISYMQQTLMPWLRRWEQEINKKLINTSNNSIYAEFMAEEILRGNTPERFNAYKTARESGWLSVNEIRKRENLNPITGGDVYIQPLNYVDSEYANEVQVDDGGTTSSRAWLMDSVRRCVAIIRNTHQRKADKASEEDWNDWLLQQDYQLRDKVSDILEPACIGFEFNPQLISQELLMTCDSAIHDSKTRKQSVESCNNWAKSFANDSSLDIVIKRSIENE